MSGWCAFALLSDSGFIYAILILLIADFSTQLAVFIKCMPTRQTQNLNDIISQSAIDSTALMVTRILLLPLLFWLAKVVWHRQAKKAKEMLHGTDDLDDDGTPLEPRTSVRSGDLRTPLRPRRDSDASVRDVLSRKQEYVGMMKTAGHRRNVILGVAFVLYTAQAVYMGIKTVVFEHDIEIIEGCLGFGAMCCFLEYFLLLDALKVNTRDEGELILSLHPHPLFYDIGLECHGCDICHESMKKPHYDAHRCRTCDFDLCPRCYKNKDNPEFKGVGGLRNGEDGPLTTWMYCKRLIGFSIEFWPLLLMTAFALVSCQCLYVATPNVQGRILDAVNEYVKSADKHPPVPPTMDKFKDLILLFVIINVLLGFFSGLQALGIQLVMTRLRNAVRVRLFSSIMRMDIGFFDAMHTGQLQSRMNNDCTAMIDPLEILIEQMLANTILLFGGGVMAFHTSWKLAILAMTVVPPISYVYRLYARWGRKLNRSIWQAYGECSKVSNEALSNIRTVRAFAAEEHERDNFSHGIDVTGRLQNKNAFVGASVNAFRSYMNLSTSTLILWYGGSLVMMHMTGMTIGKLMTFQLYWNMINNSFLSLGNVFNELIRSSSAAERVLQMIDAVPEMDPDVGEHVETVVGHIVIEEVRFTYRTRPHKEVLGGVSLELHPKKVTALVGKSGGGKSTLVHLLLRYYDPTGGRILYDGKDLRTLCARDVRKSIGFVGQDTQLFAKSIRENLTYGLGDVPEEDIVYAAKLANAHEFIAEMEEGYETRCGEKGILLSGGQKQRLALARCFLRKPTVLLLDEATSALDAENEALVQEGIDKLLLKCESTVCLIAHRLSTVIKAFQIAVIHNGIVAEIGSHQNLVARKGIYAKLVGKQLARDENIIKETSTTPKSETRQQGCTEIDALFATMEKSDDSDVKNDTNDSGSNSSKR
eukprot:GEMP01003115.1.p1 GENE.GEMP01003115.1~~GEMP01003115.1.p1  ORF type:complete len:929 (+),score=200.85 GEMP01003115.1:92-2878(+)